VIPTDGFHWWRGGEVETSEKKRKAFYEAFGLQARCSEEDRFGAEVGQKS